MQFERKLSPILKPLRKQLQRCMPWPTGEQSEVTCQQIFLERQTARRGQQVAGGVIGACFEQCVCNMIDVIPLKEFFVDFYCDKVAVPCSSF